MNLPPECLAELELARMELTARLVTAARLVAGFKRGDRLDQLGIQGSTESRPTLKDSASGEINEQEVLRNSGFECFHCGSLWRDDGEFGAVRVALDRSSHYVRARAEALPENVGFSFPQWINRRLPWGAMMLRKLKAHATANELGNFEPLKLWWQKVAGRTWDPDMMHKRDLSISPGSYDPAQLIPDELARDMAVDCQQDQEHMERTGKSITGWFWYIVRVYDRQGNSKQLARGFVKSWEAWIAVQKRWKVPNDRVVIDIDQWPTQIMQKAAEEREILRIAKPKPPFYLRERVVTWYLLAAENTPSQLYKGHRDGNPRPWSPDQPLPVVMYDAGGKKKVVHLKKVRFGKRTIQLQLDALRSGTPGMPRFEVLDRKFLEAATAELEKGNLTYQKQMDAQYYSPDLKKYVEARPDDHYSWCEQALLVRQAMDGLFGHVSMFQPGENGEAKVLTTDEH